MTRRLLPVLALLSACGLIGAGSGGGSRVPPTPSPDRVATAVAVTQTTATFSGACRLHATASTCRWEVQRNGVAVAAIPDGLTFSTTGPKPAPGDSVVYQVRMKWVNPVGAASPGWSGWLSRTHVEGFPVPPTPPTDSIVSVIITATP